MLVITGGAGFIGSNIAAALEEAGRGPIVICDRLRQGEKWRNIAKRALGDLIDPENLFDFLDAHEGTIAAIIHMGAVTSTTEADADRVVATNFRLPARLWRWCARSGVPFIYASSAATYGGGDRGFDDDPTTEALARLRPLNLYGWSKHLFDRWLIGEVEAGRPAPPRWVGLKFFNVYGPNEAHKGAQKSVVAGLYPRIAAGEPARLFASHNPRIADGDQRRDFVWVGDCADVVVWLLGHPEVSGLFNCGSGRARSFLEFAHAVFAATGRTPVIEFVQTPEQIRDKHQYFTEARMDRLRAAGYDRTFTSLEDGVATYVQCYLAAPDPCR
ncbi:MAG: ADP-glyceromanno-heptose 6-epimerase [Rhodospirillales bacterium]|nr:ADP-glyceromanno-heptose 6-epimerase [Rhodospirillales bacterium]